VTRPQTCTVVGVGSATPGPRESLLAAARRAVHDVAGLRGAVVWPLDLSGPTALFGCDSRDTNTDADVPAWPSIAFRPLTRADFRDVVAWQAQPHVARWWQDEATSTEAAEAHYGPALDGDDPARLWVLELNGRSVGFLQDYRIGDHPAYALLTARPDAVGIDYLVGDPGWVGRGVGTRVLWAFLRDVVVPGYPEAREVFAAPDHRNAASLRVLDKLGFARGLWFDEPRSDGGVDTVVGCTLDVPAVLA
jgi:aminoglycoside 6'-N-acetyltransferase